MMSDEGSYNRLLLCEFPLVRVSLGALVLALLPQLDVLGIACAG